MEILFYLFIAFAFLQLIFIGGYYLPFAFQIKKSERKASTIPVSIVVAANNEKTNLLELIPLLLQQNYPTFELIIIDDRSYDDTFDTLRELYGQHPLVHLLRIDEVHDHTSAKKFALTMGIKAAKYERILFTDADCRPSSSLWIQEMMEPVTEKSTFILGYSPYIPSKGFLNLMIRFETLVTGIQYLSFASRGIPYMGVGRNLSYTKSSFLQNKGFHPYNKLIGGDDDLYVNSHANGTNTVIACSPDSQMKSFPKTTWADWIFQKKRHMKIGKKYSFGSKFMLGCWHLSHIGFWWLGLVLAFIYGQPEVIITILGCRLILLILAYNKIIQKLGETVPIYFVPLLDLMYTFYYFATGLVSLRGNNVKWKN